MAGGTLKEFAGPEHPQRQGRGSSELPCVLGYTPSGEYIIVVYESIDEDTIYPVTAYEVPEP